MMQSQKSAKIVMNMMNYIVTLKQWEPTVRKGFPGIVLGGSSHLLKECYQASYNCINPNYPTNKTRYKTYLLSRMSHQVGYLLMFVG